MGTLTSYVPYDYRRLCDICGVLHMRSALRRKGPLMICDDHAGERIDEELDRANARQRPFRVLPVPNAKPEDQGAPEVFESEESLIVALLDQARGAGARYLQVVSGSPAPQVLAADVIPTNAWGCVHYYGLMLATYPKGHVNVWPAQILPRFRSAADTVLALQNVTGTVATNAYYGALIASGSTFAYSEDAMIGGLALLYAYRTLGDLKYLYGARAAASFLRNLQAIGSNGVNFTSSDAAGTSRLYTGGITNFVNAVAFYADHRFYPSSLLALWFWNELKLTDGDQTLGATAAIAGAFTTAPSKLLTACMADLRAFWATGTYDVTTLAVRNGFTATTPAECFNAYPAAKPNTSVSGSDLVGTGSWIYQDAATTGTMVTALNFAKGLAGLFAVDGLTDQITAIDTWLQTFTSNPAYATGTASEGSLAHATTGTFDPTVAPPKFLLVRDSAHGYASIAMNGSSLYDWGAFGLMTPIWVARRALAFKLARIKACAPLRRLSDGLPSDGFWDDRGFQRGRQGLTTQTAFIEALDHGSGVQAT